MITAYGLGLFSCNEINVYRSCWVGCVVRQIQYNRPYRPTYLYKGRDL